MHLSKTVLITHRLVYNCSCIFHTCPKHILVEIKTELQVHQKKSIRHWDATVLSKMERNDHKGILFFSLSAEPNDHIP